jgi:N-methylhydantoinase A
MLLGVDVGGTFTDAVLIADGAIHTAKAPTTPDDQSSGVLAAIDGVLERASAKAGSVSHLAHGMTVGTNALLERRGARTALVATEGFTDLLEIGRQDRVSLYRLCADRPPPLAAAELRVGVAERMSAGGVVETLSDEEIDRVAGRVEELEPEAVAVCLLFSYLDPSHEERLAEELRRRLPETHVSVSSEVLPRFREYERCSTTVTDAYLSPLLGRYLERLRRSCESRGLPEPLVMQSSGGVATLADAGRGAAWSVLSGPAGGAVGAALVAGLSDIGDVVGLDMGGTSCDVCVIEDGRVRRTAGRELNGRPIELPMVDIHTVGAGGGSIGWRDRGGALRVGPRSAGADPGPACYGKGGGEPTVTDADLLLGYLDAGATLAGGIDLDHDAAEASVARLGEALGLDPIKTAEGIVRVAEAEMIGALRVVTVERGVDPRGFGLLAFGGAGGLHAAAIATELGIGRVLMPRSGGVLSALGLAVTDRRRDVTRTVMLAGDELRGGRVAEEVSELAYEAERGLDPDRRLEVVYELRYAGQAFELDVPGPLDPDLDELLDGFAAAHERHYGYSDPAAAVELVGIRVAAIEPGPEAEPRASEGRTERGRRQVRLGGEWIDAEVVRGEPPAGARLAGPCMVELADSTLLVPPGAEASVDQAGTIDMRLPR